MEALGAGDNGISYRAGSCWLSLLAEALSTATTENRDFTREIGLWAYQEGYSGIKYVTRHTPSLSCWAVFSGSEFVPVAVKPSAEIAPNDPDLIAVANEFGLALPGDGD